MSALILRNAFSDFHGLAQLGCGSVPDCEETRRRIFIAERRSDHQRPDHFYKGYLDQRLGKARHVGELPFLALSQLAERYLERRDGRVTVRYDSFLEWHELLPHISPLCVVAAFLVAEGAGPGPGQDPRDYLAREIGETALLSTSDLHLEDLIERDGLYELHMHLNGSTELDILWNAAVANPRGFYREIEAERGKNERQAAELYDQLEPGLTPYTIFKRLRAARRVRWWLAQSLRSERRTGASAARSLPETLDGILEVMSQEAADNAIVRLRGQALTGDPSDLLHGAGDHRQIVKEAAWLYDCLQHLSRRPDDVVAGTGLYFTLLVLSQVRRLSVQQVDEFGFDQFQKYTMVGTREGLERRYLHRFRQLNLRAPYDMLAHLEGRFAPKSTVAEGRALIGNIVEDFHRFAGCDRCKEGVPLPMTPVPCLTAAGCPGTPCAWEGRRLMELSLVGHFIKSPPRPAGDAARQARDSELRGRVDRQARVLKRLVGNGTIRSLVRGVDAAANELDAGPEPFAAAYRIARRAGIGRATFHAGEDFRHLISGMRAVEEALTFLDLRTGDRIGHATAIGIDPALWMARAGPRALLRRIDHLDDLVFAHPRLAAIPGFAGEVVKLETQIALHSTALYGEELSATLLSQEWGLRSMDPMLVHLVERAVSGRGERSQPSELAEEARHLSRIAIDEVAEAEFAHIASMIEQHGAAFDLFRRRHRLETGRCREWVEVEAALLPQEAYGALQDHVLAEVNRRGIALETLPTSNLRISYYRRLDEHHLFRWLGLRGPALVNQPTVVIGSDDPGIFATNLKNEFAAVASVLRTEFGMTADHASQMLTRLNDAARIRRFRPGELQQREAGR
ncbi:MAG TPA: hypothetical protein VF548_06400 [Allosphingosinicella sp.]